MMNLSKYYLHYDEFSVHLQYNIKMYSMNLRVKEVCKERGMTMEALAKLLDITPNTLTRNINGNPTIETLGKIASALEVPVTDLFEQPAKDVVNCPYCGGKIKIGKE
ncbi:DNA-binding XRE family transcriptional regulator [Parabacteroides sp. PFB2-12]|uniref:helix-turn-helix domain-containing protein n=1 Tax=unclassified Parabacteroides TaxID=2649774 RepID=UPI002475531E|nr:MULTISPECIES: helix-turn-helix transcriptional regulator [unclassified Parabacteroides]MDH6342923.1 DNA-binding XRE family transcriptional regulator [Parabacteroides sp. PM6-13]MDH6391062.1 DNA-binding XRE family transcriptional regulator [Parabacteroides sp. PFB2-12]